MRRLTTQPGFILLETIVALGLLVGGLFSFESMEIMMQRRERQALNDLQVARQHYETHHPVLPNA